MKKQDFEIAGARKIIHKPTLTLLNWDTRLSLVWLVKIKVFLIGLC